MVMGNTVHGYTLSARPDVRVIPGEMPGNTTAFEEMKTTPEEPKEPIHVPISDGTFFFPGRRAG